MPFKIAVSTYATRWVEDDVDVMEDDETRRPLPLFLLRDGLVF